MSTFPQCVCSIIRLTAWKTNAYADEEQPPRHCWKRRPLVRGAALGWWRVHGALLHLLLLEYIGAKLSPAACFWIYLLLVLRQVFFLLLPPVPVRLPTPPQSRCTAKSLSELTQRRAQHLAWTSPPVSSFPHQSPVGNEEAGPFSTIPPSAPPCLVR